CRNYFKTLYSGSVNYQTSNAESVVEKFLGQVECPRLSQEDKNCDEPFISAECKAALDGMKNNTAPSVSGFSKEFIKFFWSDLETIILSYITQVKEKKQFFVTQRRGVITLIPKPGDQKLIKNKRAICLLDIVYKIVAKVLANRIMFVISKLVAPDQTGSIRGRYIGKNIRTVADVIEYCESDGLSGILMALDFQNAFNTVEHKFIYDTLAEFNFGSNFIEWAKLLHKDTELSVINNGYTSRWFKPSRGLQQGCPASALLFCLTVEILAIKIRNTPSIQGVNISGHDVKISQYIDDTTLFLKNDDSGRTALDVIKHFGTASGLQLNLAKSQFMWLGTKKNSQNLICGLEPCIKIKILGVKFCALYCCEEENIRSVDTKIQNTLNQWSSRDLSLKGKITVAKSLILSQLVYIISAVRIDRKHLQAIQSKIRKFIWRGRPPKVARNTLYQDTERGGLNVPDVLNIYKALRVSWFGRTLSNVYAPYSKILQARLGIRSEHLLHMNYGNKWINSQNINPFYKEMLQWLREAVPITEPKNGREVRRQVIWNN
ncbi:MAG: reverse transcriptase family protein, partial [Bacteroidota bacterium]